MKIGRLWTGPGRRTVVALCVAAMAAAGCSGEEPDDAPPTAGEADDVDAAATDETDGEADGGATADVDPAGDETPDPGSDPSDTDGGNGSNGGYQLVDEVCETFDHAEFEAVHGIPSVVVADDVTTLGGLTDYLYCELDAGTATGPDGQTLGVAIFFHQTPEAARGVFDGHAEGKINVGEVVGPWTEAVLVASPVTSGGRYTASLFLIDGTLDVWVQAQTTDAFPMDVWAEPLERIALEILASLRTG